MKTIKASKLNLKIKQKTIIINKFCIRRFDIKSHSLNKDGAYFYQKKIHSLMNSLKYFSKRLY